MPIANIVDKSAGCGKLESWKLSIAILNSLLPFALCLLMLFFLNSPSYAIPSPLINDAFIPPKPPHGLELPAGAAVKDGTEFLHGRIGVIIIFPESNGSVDANEFNWTSAQVHNCTTEIENGANWWIQKAGDTGKLEFTYYVYNSLGIDYETIRRNMSDENGDQATVLRAILNALGQPTVSTPFEDMKTFNNSFRDSNPNLDWVFTVILANDGGTDIRFPNSGNLFAFAYLGGPFMVMTYSNNGWGINNTDVVFAHEMGHIFYALDEYSDAGICPSETSGYVPTRNENTLACGGGVHNEGTCIMRSSTQPISSNTICPYTRGQVGLQDSDNDYIPDILDTTPMLTITEAPPSSTSSESFQIQGICFSESIPNRNPQGERNNITINQIDTVQIRIDSGTWQGVTPIDQFDTPKEKFRHYVSNYSTGTHALEIRGAVRVGHDSTRLLYTLTNYYTFYSSYTIETSIEPFFPAFGTCTNIINQTLKWKKWNRENINYYRVDFSDSSSFSPVLYSCTSAANETSVNYTLPMNLYYWRVIGIDNTGSTETSNWYSLWIDTASPSKPIITKPAADSFFVKRQPRCTFGDLSDTGCGIFQMIVSYSTDANFSSDTNLYSTDSSFLIKLPDSGRFYIRFAVKDNATNVSDWSDSVSILLGAVGDFDNNQKFDAEDLFSFALKFGQSSPALPAADLDENGTIDVGDVRVLLEDL